MSWAWGWVCGVWVNTDQQMSSVVRTGVFLGFLSGVAQE